MLLTICDIPHDILMSILCICYKTHRELSQLKRVCKTFAMIVGKIEARHFPLQFDATPRHFTNFARYVDDYKRVTYTRLSKEFILLPTNPRELTFSECRGRLRFPNLKDRRVRLSGWFYTSSSREKKRYVERVCKFGSNAMLNLSQFERLNLAIC